MKNIFHIMMACLIAFSIPAHSETVDVNFTTKNGVTLNAKLFLPQSTAKVPLVVVLHGCAGMYSFSNPANGLNLQTKEWGKRLNDAGYGALFIDSFGGRSVRQDQCDNGSAGVSEVTERPYDAYYGAYFAIAQNWTRLDIAKVALMGWSHGGSSTLSAMSQFFESEMGTIFKAAYAVYPGCGLYGAFGGISTSTYKAYAPIKILHGGIDPLYTGGYCDNRVNNSMALGSNKLSMTVYPGAQHSFDSASVVAGKWTQADVDAKSQEVTYIMSSLQALFN